MIVLYRAWSSHGRVTSLRASNGIASMIQTVSRARVEEALDLLKDHVELVEDSQQIAPGLRVMLTPGHTPGHASLAIQAGDERVFILGDIMHSAVQVEHPTWPNSLDIDSNAAQQTRERVLVELERPRTIAGTSHFSDAVMGRVIREQGKRRWQPLP